MLEKDGRILYNGLTCEYIEQQLKRIAAHPIENNIVDYTKINEKSVLLYDGEEFIRACYHFFFNREVDESGLLTYSNLLEQGMRKEGIMYCLAQSEEFNHRFELNGIEEYRKYYREFGLDASEVIQYSGREFVKHCFSDIIGREADESGMYTFSKMMASGMPKEAVLYLFISSEEVKNLRKIKNEEEYRKVYESFLQRSSRKGIINIFKRCIEKITFRKSTYSEVVASTNVLTTKLESVQQENATLKDEMRIIQSRLDNQAVIYDRLEKWSKGNKLQFEKQMDFVREIEMMREEQKDGQQKIADVSVLLGSVRKEIEVARFELKDIDRKLDDYSVNSKTTVQGYRGGVTCVQVGQFLMGIPSEEWRLAMYLSRYGAFEKGTELLFSKTIQKGMTVLDVGANLGIYTLHALSKDCIVYSFEPTPRTFRLLQENVRVNGFAESGKAHLIQAAVGQNTGTCRFATYDDVCGHNSIYGLSKEDAEVIEVPMVSLDERFAPGTKIDVIKIDVEGAERLVFRGMARILQENPQIKIFMEFAPEHLLRAGVDPKEMLDYLSSKGLSYCAINENNGEIDTYSVDELVKVVSVNLLIQFSED